MRSCLVSEVQQFEDTSEPMKSRSCFYVGADGDGWSDLVVDCIATAAHANVMNLFITP